MRRIFFLSFFTALSLAACTTGSVSIRNEVEPECTAFLSQVASEPVAPPSPKTVKRVLDRKL